MKSALARRLVFTLGGLLVVLFIFVGINVGYELPADRVMWFSAAFVIALLLIGYARYTVRAQAKAEIPPSAAASATPAADGRAQSRAADDAPQPAKPADVAKHAN